MTDWQHENLLGAGYDQKFVSSLPQPPYLCTPLSPTFPALADKVVEKNVMSRVKDLAEIKTNLK